MSTTAKKRPTKKVTKTATTKSKRKEKKKASPVQAKTVLVLRTCNADMTSHGGFKWPTSGPVECPDWKPIAQCGNGLHGLLWGEGDATLLDHSDKAKWLVVAVNKSSIVDLGKKVKFPRGEVVFCGDRRLATNYLAANGGYGKRIVFATATAGDGGTATAGDWGTATAGDWGTATAGDWGTATAGDWGTATAGNGGTATAGDGGTATAGDWGTATAGDGGTAAAGDWGTAAAGDGGTAAAGDGGTAAAGDGGAITILFYDSRTGSYRRIVGAVGDGGLKPNVKYRLNDKGEFETV